MSSVASTVFKACGVKLHSSMLEREGIQSVQDVCDMVLFLENKLVLSLFELRPLQLAKLIKFAKNYTPDLKLSVNNNSSSSYSPPQSANNKRFSADRSSLSQESMESYKTSALKQSKNLKSSTEMPSESKLNRSHNSLKNSPKLKRRNSLKDSPLKKSPSLKESPLQKSPSDSQSPLKQSIISKTSSNDHFVPGSPVALRFSRKKKDKKSKKS